MAQGTNIIPRDKVQILLPLIKSPIDLAPLNVIGVHSWDKNDQTYVVNVHSSNTTLPWDLEEKREEVDVLLGFPGMLDPGTLFWSFLNPFSGIGLGVAGSAFYFGQSSCLESVWRCRDSASTATSGNEIRPRVLTAFTIVGVCPFLLCVR